MRTRAIQLAMVGLAAALAAVAPGRAAADGLCSLSVTAPASMAAVAGQGITFSAVVNAANCAGTVTLDWDFGDGTPHSLQPTPVHVYAAPGIYTWTLVAALEGTAAASASGTVNVVAPGPPYTYLMFIARNPGRGNTHWSSDVSVVNLSNADATVNFTFKTPAGDVPTQVAVPVGQAILWPNATSSLFGVDGVVQGAVLATSNTPVSISVRSFTPFGGGTVGQEYQAVTPADAIVQGVVGLLPDLRDSDGFRTNIGFLNVSDTDATVGVTLFDSDGLAVGSALAASVPAWQWVQVTDVFAKAGAPPIAFAYARVQVQTAGSRVWSYASVIDSTTGDPATITVRVP